MFEVIETKTIQLPKPELELFTLKSLKDAIPVKVAIDQNTLDQVNQIIENEEVAEYFRDNLISFSSVLSSPNMSIKRYIDAVKFVSYVLMDYGYVKAWKATFPDKYQRLTDNGSSVNIIQSHVTSYRKNKLVSKVLEQAMIPSYIYNASLFQEAINTQASIMRDDTALNRDRIAAAESVLKYTQLPEHLLTNKQEIAEQGLSIIEKLADSINKLSETQSDLIRDNKVSVKEIAHSKIIEGEYEDVS